jgi:hypothetical protein
MSQKIDLEQLASFLKDRKKDRRKKQKKKKKKKFKLVVLDGRQETQTRSGIVNKLGIQENVTDARKEPAYDKLKKRADEGSLNLIYALQKDVKDIQTRFMGGPIQPQQTPFSPFPRVKPQQLTAQGLQDRNASFDLAIKAQTEAREIKKNQDRIEKEAKAEVKRLEAEAKAEVKRLEKEAKEEQARARAEQKALIKEQTKINKELEKQLSEQERKDEEVTRLLKVRADRERAKDQKKQSLISNYTIAQGMRTFTNFLPNPPDIGGGGGLPPLPFNRERDQYDPLEPTPFYRSTADRIEAPVLQEVLDSLSAPAPPPPSEADQPEFQQEESDQQEESEFPPPEDESMDFMTDDALLGGGASDVTGGDVTTTGKEDQALEEDEALVEETPVKKKVVISGEPIVVSGKKKGGRPLGSKNKPKPVPSDPSQVAMLGGSSVVGRTPKGKTPANTPSGSAN